MHLSYNMALSHAAASLRAVGIEAPRQEARRLLAHLLGIPPGALPSAITLVDAAALAALVARRTAREPLAYITGSSGFWTFEVAVSPATLIPRPDSETLIEAALAEFPDRRVVRNILDLGTGTGCLLLAALQEFPCAFGVGVDRVAEAARLAAGNAARLAMQTRAAFLAADWAAPLSARFDLILCNPPYIHAADIASLMPEVAHHEPGTALSGGADGLDAYRVLMPRLAGLLAPHGCAVFELGQGQAPEVAELARRAGFGRIATRADLGGIDRALVLRWEG
jgi:release factor glutamine methyltransferase